MRILLVNPPIPRSFYNREFHLPAGLLAIAAVLKRNGDDVTILDLKAAQHKNPAMTDEDYDRELVKAAARVKPEMVGFGGLFSGNFRDVLRMSRLSKQEFPDVPVIMGGVHAVMFAEDILKHCRSFDWLALGEADDTMVDLVNMMKQQKTDWERLQSFAYRRNDGVPVINPRLRYIRDLDALPFPAYDLINFTDYEVDTSGWHNPKNLVFKMEVPIHTSRSCPFDCNFCAAKRIMGRGWRARSPRNVADEIELLYHKYGQRHFAFMDDNFTFQKDRLLGICSEIGKRNLDIQFETHNGVSIKTLDEEMIDAMVGAGLTRIALPIESGSDFIRNTVMRKGLPRERIDDVVRWLRKHSQKISIRAFFIIGMPEETPETLQDTYNMIRDLRFDKVHLTNIVPFPGTAVFEQAMRDGLFTNKIDLDNLYLADTQYQTNFRHFSIKPYKMTVEQLLEFRERCEAMTYQHA
jgi:radical SAM superfamily enzyme YgiQ (UPF0313 family)